MFGSFEEFLLWQQASIDTIDVKRHCIDMAGDLAAGVFLSQIVFYHLSATNGKSKLGVEKDGYLWLAKKREDWWDECRLTPRQVDRAVARLRNKGLIETGRYRFNGTPTLHIRLMVDQFLEQLAGVLMTNSADVIMCPRPRKGNDF